MSKTSTPNRTPAVGALAIGSVAAFAACSDQDPATARPEDVLATIGKMTQSLAKGDLEGVMSTYEEPAVVMFEPGVPVADRAAIRTAFQELIAISPQMEFGEHEVFIAGDIALHLTPWNMRGTAPDGSVVESGGLSVAVLRRQADGGWLMVIDNPHGGRTL